MANPTVRQFGSLRGKMTVRTHQSGPGVWVATVTDDTGGLMNGDRTYTSTAHGAAEGEGIKLIRQILGEGGCKVYKTR